MQATARRLSVVSATPSPDPSRSAKEMHFPTQQIDAWLGASGTLPLLRDGFASCALLTDFAQVCRINQEMRSLPEAWPDDHWIIGEDGAGGYFVVSKSDKYRGVQFFDHEWKLFEEFQPTLRKFFDYCIEIEKMNQAEPSR
jgi:hypothetical protein